MQNLSIRGLINARDPGGLAAADGRRVRAHRLIRTEALNNLTEDGAAKLREYGLRTIIDLRTETERNEKPDPVLPGVQLLQIPIFEEETAGITREEGSAAQLSRVPDMDRLYRHMVTDEHSVEQLARVIRAVMATEGGCVLFHCTAGKDRTGVTAMLLLGILGVSDEDILEDYLYTNVTGTAAADAYSSMVFRKTGDAALAENVRRAFLAEESYLSGAMSVIKEHGGYERYFTDRLHIPADEIQRFREKMLIDTNTSP